MILARPRSHRSAKALIGLAAAAVALPLLAACGGGGSGSADGPLTVYSGRSEELVGPLFAQFTEQTGIELEARYGDTAELAAQLIEEGDASPAQVYFAQDAGALGAVDAAGLFAPLPASVATTVPEAYRAPNADWTGVTGRARVIAYDPEQVPAAEVPQSVFDLTDPKWKGQVAIAPTAQHRRQPLHDRSHALRGNAALDAPASTTGSACCAVTQSVTGLLPRRSVGAIAPLR